MSHTSAPQLLIPLAFAGVRRVPLGYLRSQGRQDRAAALETWAALNGYRPRPRSRDGSTPTLEPTTAGRAVLRGAGGRTGRGALRGRGGRRRPSRVGSGRDPGDRRTRPSCRPSWPPAFRTSGWCRGTGAIAPAHGGDEREVELESVEFQRDHRLLAGRDGDREALLRLFDPDTIVWWIDLGALAPIVEYQTGHAGRSAATCAALRRASTTRCWPRPRIAGRVLAEGLLHQPARASLPPDRTRSRQSVHEPVTDRPQAATGVTGPGRCGPPLHTIHSPTQPRSPPSHVRIALIVIALIVSC